MSETDAASPAPTPATPEPSPPAPAPSAPESRRAVPTDARGLPDWIALIDQAGLRGPLGQLAQNAALRDRDGQTLTLVLQEAHMHLAVEPMVGQMEERVSDARAASQTPAARAAEARDAAQARAEQAIEEDPLVQALKRDFGARVVPQSIKPVSG